METIDKVCRQRLYSAGYKFIRLVDEDHINGALPKIKVSETFGSWRTLYVFTTKAARDRRALELVMTGKYLSI